MASSTAVTKAKTALSKTGKSIASNPKTAMYVGVGIVALLGIYAVSKLAFKVGDIDFGNDPNAGGGNLNPDQGNNVPSGSTITKNQAQIIAAGLHQAMVILTGTDEERIFQLLAGKTPRDFAMISEAFGQPRYDDFGDAFWPFPKKSLSYWLNSELNEQEMARLKMLMPGVL